MTAITPLNAPSAEEQELFEMLNRARLDPQGEYDRMILDGASQTGTTDRVTDALRFFNVDAASYQAQLQALDAQAPLAWSGALSQSADAYSNLMIAEDTQSHTLTDPSQLPQYDNNSDGQISLSERMIAQGYSDRWITVRENLAAFGEDNFFTHASLFLDWGYDAEDISGGFLNADWTLTGDGIQDPAGHRDAIMFGDLQEVGIAIVADSDPSTQLGPNVVTQHLAARRDYNPQLLGVVIRDADDDTFYDIGEGLGGITVTATQGDQSMTTTTWASGGYQLELMPGTYTVTFSGDGLDGVITQEVQMGDDNLKLDARARNAVQDTGVGSDGADTLPGTPDNDTLRAGAGDDLAFAGAGDDLLQGETGNDTLYGALGNDTLLGGDDDDLLGGAAGADSMDGGAGNDEIWGGADNDTLIGGDGQDSLGGAAGNDSLAGGTGADELWGAAGDDTLLGGDGDDTLGGSLGNDSLSGGAGADEMWGAAGFDMMLGGDGNDQIGAGSDSDVAEGGDGNDTVSGGLGDDTLNGDAGDDLIFAALGDDVIAGGTGNDTIFGGGGADSFDFNAGDGADQIYASLADDTLLLDAGLWTGTLTEAQVITSFGAALGADYVLTFGSDSVTLMGLASATQAQLETLIEIG